MKETLTRVFFNCLYDSVYWGKKFIQILEPVFRFFWMTDYKAKSQIKSIKVRKLYEIIEGTVTGIMGFSAMMWIFLRGLEIDKFCVGCLMLCSFVVMLYWVKLAIVYIKYPEVRTND